MRRRVLIAALGLALAGLLLGAEDARAGHESLGALLPGSALEGSRLFAGKGCLGCHSVHGAGGTAGPDLGRGILNRPLLEIAAVTWNHAPGMEHVLHEKRLARPTFAPAEMASLLSFLYYLGSLDPPGDRDRGAALFRDKGCQACHSVGKDGGRIGPDLTRYGRYASPLYLTAALWNRGRAMAEAMEARKMVRPVFQGNDIPDLLAHLRSASGSTERIYAPPGNPKRGEALFRERHCMECHAVRGHGGKVGPDLAVVLRGSLMRIAGTMWNHGPRMWARMAERRIDVPSFTTEEMSDLVSYLYFFQFIDPPGNARRGLVVYREKRCGTCHGPEASKPVAPPFTAVVEKLETPLGVITAMWNHAGRMAEIMTEENVAWPLLRSGEMADLIAYLLEAHGAEGPVPGRKGATAPNAARESRVTK
ncbi:MAG: c-type cytochrome [Candidatus Rokubacteria bacterium]|nr:c-type cytochrome [Candidatus Rokubacteria bacterium]